MVFDIGNGLSEAGKSVAATAGAATLEMQKADLENEKIKLADELAGARQDKQNIHAAGESLLNRASAEKISADTNATHLEVGKMTAAASMAHAGATLESAKMMREMQQKQLDQNLPLLQAQIRQHDATTEVEQLKYAGQVVANTVARDKARATTELQAAQESGDPARIEKATQQWNIINLSSSEMHIAAQAAATVAQLAEREAASLRTQYNQASDESKGRGMTPESQAALKTMAARVKEAEDKAARLLGDAARASNAIPKLNISGSGSPNAADPKYGTPPASP